MTYAKANGQTVTKLRMLVGARGPWFADLTLDGEAPGVAGRVTLEVAGIQCVGTVPPSTAGEHGKERQARLVAGGGAWGAVLGPKGYHNDAQVRALNVAQDAAREAGETLGSFAPERERVGIAYVREAGPASRVLEDVIGSASWWVDFAGVTHVGARPSSTPPESAYEVVDYDPREQVVQLRVLDLAQVGIGAVLTKGLDGPKTVRDLEVVLDADELRVRAWCGASAAQSRLAGLFRALVERSTDGDLFGSYRYRVIRMVADRVELQAVRKGAGLPDLLPVSMAPGMAGVHAVLAPGAEVLVQFVEGDRTLPLITHFAGRDGTGFAPISLVIGGAIGAPSARAGDSVQVTLPPATVVIAPGTPPVTSPVVYQSPVAVGTITSGSSRVSVAP
jgi:hypothetical protein